MNRSEREYLRDLLRNRVWRELEPLREYQHYQPEPSDKLKALAEKEHFNLGVNRDHPELVARATHYRERERAIQQLMDDIDLATFFKDEEQVRVMLEELTAKAKAIVEQFS